MKKYLLSLVVISSIVFAQEVKEPSQADIEKMMAGMQGMQTCMAKIDMSSLQSIQQEALKVKDKVEKMCADGKREKAQKTAISYAKKMMKMPALVQMKKCTAGFVPDTNPIEELKKQNVCDTGFDIK